MTKSMAVSNFLLLSLLDSLLSITGQKNQKRGGEERAISDGSSGLPLSISIIRLLVFSLVSLFLY